MSLEATVQQLLAAGHGILAADQGSDSLSLRLEALGLSLGETTYRDWCEMLITTPNLSDHISGVIMRDEAAHLGSSEGVPFPELVIQQGMLPGLSPSTGLVELAGTNGEVVPEGLDGLRQRLHDYREMGFKFTKWRAPIRIGENMPSDYAIDANTYVLAQFAALSQEAGLVPIVEPETELLGDHTIKRCLEVTELFLHRTFQRLYEHRVQFEGLILKTNMVVPGEDCPTRADVQTVAEMTVKCLRRCVPPAVQGITFLSGGQSDYDSTAHLSAVNAMGAQPWTLSFSYARALQRAPLVAWKMETANRARGQAALYHRARMNGLASLGKWSPELEESATVSA